MSRVLIVVTNCVAILLLAFSVVSMAQNIQQIPSWLHKLSVNESGREYPLINAIQSGSDEEVVAIATELTSQFAFVDTLSSRLINGSFKDLLQVPYPLKIGSEENSESEFLYLVYNMGEIYREHRLNVSSQALATSDSVQSALDDLTRAYLHDFVRRLVQTFGWRLPPSIPIDRTTLPISDRLPILFFPSFDETIYSENKRVEIFSFLPDKWLPEIPQGKNITNDEHQTLRKWLIEIVSAMVEQFISLFQTLVFKISNSDTVFEDSHIADFREKLDHLYRVKVHFIERTVGVNRQLLQARHARFSGIALARGVHVYQTASKDDDFKMGDFSRLLMDGIAYSCWLLDEIYDQKLQHQFLQAFFSSPAWGEQGNLDMINVLFTRFILLMEDLVTAVDPEDSSYESAVKMLHDRLARERHITPLPDWYESGITLSATSMQLAQNDSNLVSSEVFYWFSAPTGARLSVSVFETDLQWRSRFESMQNFAATMMAKPLYR